MSAHVTDRLSAYLDRELSVVDTAAVREHLASCGACAARLTLLQTVDSGLRDLPAEAPAGYFESFASRVRERIESTPRARAGFHLPVWSWAVAAAVLVAVVLPPVLEEMRAPRVPASASPAAPARVAAAPSALPRPAERVEPSRGDADARTKPEAARKLTALESTEEAAAAGDKARANAAAETPQAMGRTAAPKEAAPRFAGAPPAPAPTAPEGQAASAAAGEPEAFSRETAAADQAVTAPLPRDGGETRAPMPQLLKKDQHQEADAGAVPEAAAGAPGQIDEGKRSRPAAARSMALPLSPVEAEYRALESRTAAASLSELRDAWRAFSVRHPDDARADEARVRVIALGIDIARRTGQGSDEAQARKDAADYLARKDAAQKERVRALLDDLSR